MHTFTYLVEKIRTAEFIDFPFPHLHINNFLSEEHLDIIINDKQIHFKKVDDNNFLYQKLIEENWAIQQFPGCLSNWDEYINYLNNIHSQGKYNTHTPVEGVGITFRLKSYKNKLIKELLEFMNSNEFHKTLREKFQLDVETTIISAIQKNLTGYEISPHPDIRQKALTYLLNINNNVEIETKDCHTHILEFKEEYKYIEDYWKENPSVQRCWVPWNWCNTIKTMNENNTLIIFSPLSSPPTLHAIKLNYDHLLYQRTQIYGNLMYKYGGSYEGSNYTKLRDINPNTC